MGAGQWKLRAIMVKVHMVPTGGVMTDRTILPILSIMRVVLLMARITILRRTFELIIHMAGFARDAHMLSFQFEGRQIVIKFGGPPAIRSMAARAVHSKSSSMWLILLMT